LQTTVHADPVPHTTVQLEAPAQLAVQPPAGQVNVQLLLPLQETVDPDPTVTLHWLPPLQVTELFVPVETVQLLVPSHVVVQLAEQLPLHVDWPAQFEVQPVPHAMLQVFFDWQSLVTPLGGVVPPPSAPPSPPGPKVQVPPELHVQVLPEQLQSPEHVPSAVLLFAPPHPRGQRVPMAAANAMGANRSAVRIVTLLRENHHSANRARRGKLLFENGKSTDHLMATARSESMVYRVASPGPFMDLAPLEWRLLASGAWSFAEVRSSCGWLSSWASAPGARSSLAGAATAPLRTVAVTAETRHRAAAAVLAAAAAPGAAAAPAVAAALAAAAAR
jgi:hypothetical protein